MEMTPSSASALIAPPARRTTSATHVTRPALAASHAMAGGGGSVQNITACRAAGDMRDTRDTVTRADRNVGDWYLASWPLHGQCVCKVIICQA